jgi:hypothetical protein
LADRPDEVALAAMQAGGIAIGFGTGRRSPVDAGYQRRAPASERRRRDTLAPVLAADPRDLQIPRAPRSRVAGAARMDAGEPRIAIGNCAGEHSARRVARRISAAPRSGDRSRA